MSKKLFPLFLFLTPISVFSQISFENEKILISNHQMAATNSEVILSDLNNDGAKDLIVTITSSSGRIVVYPNVQGDFTTTPLKIVFDDWNTTAEYPSGVSTIDVDNDGLLDIVACNRYSNKINWFRNLGNFTFSQITTLINIANGPNQITISDVDNDGFKDLVVNLAVNMDSIVWLKNNGDGTFLSQQLVHTGSNFDTTKILAKDLNNDNLPEIIVGHSNGDVYLKKNLGNGTFAASIQMAYSNSGKVFEFEDINNDSYPDYVSVSSGGSLIKQLSQSGISFGASQSIGTATFFDIKFKDIDEDGITDLVGAAGTGISYLKRLVNGTFQSSTQLISITPVTYFIADDVNNDNRTDFITPAYSNNSSANKLMAYTKETASNVYTNQLISYFNSGVWNVKIADLDNDGNNDVISSFRSLVWNKNKGGGEFTSYKKISNSYPNDGSYNFESEAVDIDNDNDKDIVTSINGGIEIYYNDGVGNFTLGYSTILPYSAINIEVADLNGDLLKDIVMTFNIGGSSGEIKLAWIPNLTGTTFGSLTTIGLSTEGYMPYLLECGDMDNDGDIDIVTYSNEFSRLHLHTNNGSGVFTYSPIGDAFSAVCIALEDFDNDGDKDIFAAGNYYPGVYLIKNNNGVFANRLLIQIKKADDIDFADLNGDGYKELIGTLAVPDSSNLGSLFYFLNSGTGFGNQVVVDTEDIDNSKARIAIGDLNNDGKPDIANSFILLGKVSYFLNTSTLSIENPEVADSMVMYPVPFSDVLNWEIPNSTSGIYDITIYNVEGKLVYSKKGLSSSSVDLKFLEKGFYIFKLESDSKSFTRNIIKN